MLCWDENIDLSTIYNPLQLRNWFCFRWREVLTSSKPGPVTQMSALVLKYPEVAEVRKSLFHFFISYASSLFWKIFEPSAMTSRCPVILFSLWFHCFEDDFIQRSTLLSSLSSSSSSSSSLSSSSSPLSPLPSPHRIQTTDPGSSFL